MVRFFRFDWNLHLSLAGASGEVIIDAVGDRSSALQLKNIQNGKYHRVFNYYNSENRLEELENRTTIVWPGNTKTAPIGRPKCGFAGELCSTSLNKRCNLLTENFYCNFLGQDPERRSSI